MICIKYFGAVAVITKCSSENIETKSFELKEVVQEIFSRYNLDHIPVKLALNKSIVTSVEGIHLKENDEIAVLPPFAGG